MHLVAPLAAGIAGAELGTVDIYRRGTSTRATYYVDFEATASVTPTASLNLDSNGRFLAYVNEYVDCICKDADGNTVVEFTAGEAAPAVEYQGQSFTGTKYDTGATGAGSGYPVDLQTILNRWKTSAGATDFKVHVGAIDLDLQDAFTSPVFFNVMDAAYGATGDGATDDTAAIGAAITAAAAIGGGIVFFPAGAYRITAALALPDKVSMLGAGAGATLLGIDHATENAVTVTSTFIAERQFIANMTIAANQANVGAHIGVSSSKGLIIRDCHLGSTYTNGSCVFLVSYANSNVIVENCHLSMGGSTSNGVYTAGLAKRCQVRNCLFTTPATFSGTPISADHIDVTDCVFDGALSTTGTFSWYTARSTTLDATIKGCVFGAGGGATVTAITLGAYVDGSVFSEAHNTFGSGVTAYSYTNAAGAATAQVQLKTRDTRFLQESNSAATYTALVQQYGTIYVDSSRAGNVSIAATGTPPAGAKFRIVFINTDVGVHNFTPASPFKSALQAINPTEFWALEVVTVTFPAGATVMVGGWKGA